MMWEYLVVRNEQSLDELNEIGRHGWELVFILEGPPVQYHFKRPTRMSPVLYFSEESCSLPGGACKIV